jgi:hypothetical protein
VVTVDPRPSSIWLVNATTGQATPLTTDKSHSIVPVWSPDGTRIAFTHYSGGKTHPTWMFAQPGAALHEVFAPGGAERAADIGVMQWTSAAGFLGYQTYATPAQLRSDVVRFGMGDSTVTSLVASPADDREPALSPDGRWLAYASTISGASEVYVRPYPQGGASTLVSSRGGTDPAWSHEGTELFYRSGSRIMSVAHSPRAAAGGFGAPRTLFSGAFDFSQEPNWSPSPDGTFVMVKGDPTIGRQLRVVFNWFDELSGASSAK